MRLEAILFLICSLLAISKVSEAGDTLNAPELRNVNKWPKNLKTGDTIVPIKFQASDYSPDEQASFYRAVRNIEMYTCVRFVNRTKQADWIYIHDGGACHGNFGKVGGKQEISLTPACMIVQKKPCHEFLHALNFHHMHQRFDRDKYLDIHLENVAADDQKWLKKYRNNQWEAYGTPFDHMSVMNYARDGFSKNGKDTIVPKNRDFIDKIGKQDLLSVGDIVRINKMYKCNPKKYRTKV